MKKPLFEKGSWTGIIGDDFTTENVVRASLSIAKWLNQRSCSSILIGFDTRFGGKMYANVAAKTFVSQGIQSQISNDYITSPSLILNMVKSSVEFGIMITASSKAAQFSGIKIKGIYSQEDIDLINTYIEETYQDPLLDISSINQAPSVDFESVYASYLTSAIDFTKIKASGLMIVYDAMFGATQSVFEKVLPTSIKLRYEVNPSFKGDIPHPTHENLELMSKIAGGTEYAKCGFATNSDGELIAMCDENGVFVNPYQILEGEKDIPWRDGLFLGFKIIEKMAVTGKNLSDLT